MTISDRLSTESAVRGVEPDPVHRIGRVPADGQANGQLVTPDSVWLYPGTASAHHSFALGRRLRADSLPVRLIQKTRSDHPKPFHHAVRLGNGLREPLSAGERGRAEMFLRHGEVELAPDADEHRVALLVVLSAKPARTAAGMREAARTGRSTLYSVGTAERCRAGLLVRAVRGLVPPDLDSFELTARYVHHVWSTWLAARGGASDQLLFFAGPNTLAAALGHLSGGQPLRIVEHKPSRLTRPARAGTSGAHPTTTAGPAAGRTDRSDRP